MTDRFDRIRIIPREQEFLNRLVGSVGDIYTNRKTGSLRVYDGDKRGGREIARADFDNVLTSAQLDLQSKKNRIRFHWDTLAELETEVDPVVYHGMIAHVHSEGRLYFAHAGEWTPVANLAEIEESASQIPYEPDTEDTLQWVEGTYDFGNNIIKYANAVQLESELENYSPVTYHGMTMHVHETGALYYAHAGEWRKLLTDTAYNDVEAVGYIDPLGEVAYSNSYVDLDNAPTSILDFGITDGANGQVLSTDGSGNFSFIDQSATGSGSFDTVESDDGAFNTSDTSSLRILGGENISTAIETDSQEVSVNLDAFSINFLSDVDTQSSPPATGEVLKWDGAKWAPGTDVAEGGSGLDADTLDGQDGSYYLDYSNFTNTPSVLTLSDLSVGNELTPSGNGAISYDDTTGVFRFTPPDLGDFLFSGTTLDTAGSAEITVTPDVAFQGAVSFTTLASTGVGTLTLDSASSVAVLAEDDIAITAGTGSIILDDQYWPQSDGTAGQVLTTDGAGQLSWNDVSGGGGDPDQNLFETVSADVGSTTADTTADTLTIAGGTDISTEVSGDTVTVSFTGSAGGASNLDELSDVSSAGIDVNDIFEAAIVTIRVNNNGATSYLFDSHYSGDNPTIYAISGTTIAFDLGQIGGHPFEIQDSGGAAISQGLVHVSANGTVSEGSNAQGFDSGTLYWRIQESVSGSYQYQCQIHAGMNGTIEVKRLSAL